MGFGEGSLVPRDTTDRPGGGATGSNNPADYIPLLPGKAIRSIQGGVNPYGKPSIGADVAYFIDYLQAEGSKGKVEYQGTPNNPVNPNEGLPLEEVVHLFLNAYPDPEDQKILVKAIRNSYGLDAEGHVREGGDENQIPAKYYKVMEAIEQRTSPKTETDR